MEDKEDTYSIVVKKVNKKPKIVTITKNGVLMKNIVVSNEDKHFPKEPSEMHSLPPELVDGCIGLGMLFDDEIADRCRWLWGKWW